MVDKEKIKVESGDIIDIVKFNNLPSPVTAVYWGSKTGWWIETLCVQTGLMRVDVCGMLERCHFSDVKELIDINGNKHNPDDFYIDTQTINN